MFERSVVVPRRRTWVLIVALAAVPLGARALRGEEPARTPCVFTPPVV